MPDFDLSEERRLLKAAAERFVERHYPFELRREAARGEEGFRRALWRRFAELGWLGVGLEGHEGGHGGAREVAVLMEAFGRGLATEPWLASVVLGGGAVALAGSPAQKAALLDPLVAGDLLLALAHGEPASRYETAAVATRAERTAGGWALHGRKALTLNGDSADRLIVSARGFGAPRDRAGLSLFVVDPAQEGVERRGYPTHDGGRAAEIELAGARVAEDGLLGEEGGAFAAIETLLDRAAAALCAESLGLMAVLNEMTLAHARTRRQFGRPIGGFQALQHRMVDMFVALEESRAITDVYMADVDSADRDERRRAVSAMKAVCDKAGRLIGREAIQIHGGIAMTDDYPASHYFKRLSLIQRQFGDIDWHLDRYAALCR